MQQRLILKIVDGEKKYPEFLFNFPLFQNSFPALFWYQELSRAGGHPVRS